MMLIDEARIEKKSVKDKSGEKKEQRRVEERNRQLQATGHTTEREKEHNVQIHMRVHHVPKLDV